MARARSIKPSFFTHEKLCELSPLHRILYSGLWTQSDRRGVLEDRPKYLKTVLLPYDECDINAMLNDLATNGFIVGYRVGELRLIFIPKFGDNQTISRAEKGVALKLPGPETQGAEITRGIIHVGSETVQKQFANGSETVSEPITNSSKTPVICNLLSVICNPKELPAAAQAQENPVPTESIDEEKTERKRSLQERFSAWFEDLRRLNLGEKYIPDEVIAIPRLNKQLKFVTNPSCNAAILARAAELFVADTWAQGLDPPAPLSIFAKQWSRWYSKANREVEAA